MKILAFTDIHATSACLSAIAAKAKKEKPDLFICCGDFTIFEHGLDEVLRKMSLLGNTLLIHGNHETESVIRKSVVNYPSIAFMHKKIRIINGIAFVGYGGGGFSLVDPLFEKFMRSIDSKIKNLPIVLFTHAPPYGSVLDVVHNSHVGNKSIAAVIKKYKNIKLFMSGHIHECFGRSQKWGKTVLLNPGPFGCVIDYVK